MSGSVTAPAALRRTQLACFLLPAAMLALGLVLRLLLARALFLNPDEALHFLLANQPSLGQAYRASLTTAHPPLLILLLYYWHHLGHAEWWLRLPSVLASEGSCGLNFLWLKTVCDRDTALTGLALLLFSPSLLELSAEVRQYALLWLFAAVSLYLWERAICEGSARKMILSAWALYLALLSHYSALIFALALGVYGVARLREFRPNRKLLAAWLVGECGALGICAFLFSTHIEKLTGSGLPREIAQTWLRSSIFHRGEERWGGFLLQATVHLFRYLLSQGTIGFLCLLLYLIGVASLSLARGRDPQQPAKVNPRALALLLAVPLVATCAAALAGVYPYGGTRHDAILAVFALSGASIGLVRLSGRRSYVSALAVLGGLLVCYLAPSPIGPYISPKNQNRELMVRALAFLRDAVPPGSSLYTDPQGRYVLSYYVCPDERLPTEPPSQPFVASRCGPWRMVSPSQLAWAFEAQSFGSQMAGVRQSYGIPQPFPLWLFQAGWIDYHEDIWLDLLGRYGCHNPQNFGPDILVCRLSGQLPPG